MRARDVRAIAFCVVTVALLFAALMVLLHIYLVALALTGAYAVWLLTRPRMVRVIRRLRGDPDWSGYYDNGGPSRRAPEGSAPNPRPAERR